MSEEPAPSRDLLDRAFDRMNETPDDDGEGFTAAALMIYDTAYLAGREAGLAVGRSSSDALRWIREMREAFEADAESLRTAGVAAGVVAERARIVAALRGRPGETAYSTAIAAMIERGDL